MVAPSLSAQNQAFLLIVAGILLIYCEFIWVGKVWFGLAGAVCALAGIAVFLRLPHTALGAVLALCAMVCFFIEAGFETLGTAGVLGSLLWAASFWKLGVSPPIASCVSALFGAVTIWLLSIAKRARRNKRLL